MQMKRAETASPKVIPAFVPDASAPERITLTDVPAPEPAAGQVLLAVDAYSVNRGETFLLQAPRPGWRPGQDVVGTVLSAGLDTNGPPTGTRVVAAADSAGWALRAVVSTSALAVLPDEVPSTVAAALPVAGLTALRLVRAAGSLAARRVLITGASGGVGHFFTELAAGQGALVTAVSASAERGERLLALGAAEVVNEIVDTGQVFDVVLESVGGESFAQAVSRLAPGGTMLWFGQAGGKPPVFDFFSAAGRSPMARIIPFSYWQSGGSDADDLATLVRLAKRGLLHPEVGLVADWRHTPEVLAAVRERRVRGNAVLTLSG
jgi:NADPH:quinone reductase